MIFSPHVFFILLLLDDSLLSLLEGLLDASVHPVSIINGWLDVEVIKFLLNVLPDLSILQEWIELDQFHDLLFLGAKLVHLKPAHSVEDSKDGRSKIILLNDGREDARDVRLVVLLLSLAHLTGSGKGHSQHL